MSDLGGQALNKVAEMGISSQLDEVKNLDVEIETDPLKLMSGADDRLAITCDCTSRLMSCKTEKLGIGRSNVLQRIVFAQETTNSKVQKNHQSAATNSINRES